MKVLVGLAPCLRIAQPDTAVRWQWRALPGLNQEIATAPGKTRGSSGDSRSHTAHEPSQPLVGRSAHSWASSASWGLRWRNIDGGSVFALSSEACHGTVGRLQSLGFPPPGYPSYQTPTLTQWGCLLLSVPAFPGLTDLPSVYSRLIQIVLNEFNVLQQRSFHSRQPPSRSLIPAG
jgi:hypothetical protein